MLMKRSQKITLYTATLITAQNVIPAKAGIQTTFLRRQETITQESGFPRIKYGAGLVKPGMTNYLRLMSSCIALTFITTCISFGTILIEPMLAYGQMRDPFSLPSGVRLLSKADFAPTTKRMPSISEGKPTPISSPSPRVNAILISDHIRLASIGRHIVTVGDSIQGERILEIENDRVILGKGDKKRTLYLSQVPIQLRVEERQGERR
jgi:hypothetical protein